MGVRISRSTTQWVVLISALALPGLAAASAPVALTQAVLTAKPARKRPPPPPPKQAPAPETSKASAPGGAPSREEVSVAPRGPTRIDFDDRLIQGQTNKSGAVYLFDRKELAIKSMVQQRTSFRDQIVKDVLSE